MTVLPNNAVKEQYMLSGECYVHSIMQGELIPALDGGEVTVQTFELHWAGLQVC